MCIFDLDNTVFDLREYDFRVFQALFEKVQLSEELVRFKEEKGYGYRHLFDDFVQENKNLSVSVKQLIDHYSTCLPPLDGVYSLLPLLEVLKLNGVRLILITNGYMKRQQYKIDSLGLASVFDAIHILDPGNDIPLKPDPQVFVNSQLSTDGCIYIGDQLEIDKLFADNCGIDFYLYRHKTFLYGVA